MIFWKRPSKLIM